MKKLVLMAAAIVAVSFASCDSKKATDAAKAQQDSIRIADSIAAVETAAVEAVQADTLATDSVATDTVQAN